MTASPSPVSGVGRWGSGCFLDPPPPGLEGGKAAVSPGEPTWGQSGGRVEAQPGQLCRGQTEQVVLVVGHVREGCMLEVTRRNLGE